MSNMEPTVAEPETNGARLLSIWGQRITLQEEWCGWFLAGRATGKFKRASHHSEAAMPTAADWKSASGDATSQGPG
jgi:hypothetical protein